VNFTPLSASMSAVELVELLNEVFSHFDTLVEKHGLEKIKTIGDAYMVAAGVPNPSTTHAQELTEMALEMQQYMEQTTFRDGHKLSIRIGINSGPVVAGVIGRKKFIYDLWGDTVNTASRMESSGVPGRIQVTEATQKLLVDQFELEERGEIEVKGKGTMHTYLLVGQRRDPTRVSIGVISGSDA
jgi:class 3 adenylate cyclase